MSNEQVQEKMNEAYQEILKAIREKDAQPMQGDFHGVLRLGNEHINRAMFFNTGEIYHANLMMQFDDDGNESPWVLVIVAGGEVEEMTEEIAIAEEPTDSCCEDGSCDLCEG